MNGILIVNKPKGMTSHDVIQRIRRLTGSRRVGHAGTLDPLATGVLVICLGKATRLAQFLQSDSKEYVAEMTLGIETDTQDGTGRVLSRKPCSVEEREIINALKDFKGPTWQIPPMTSAIKHKGKPLYKLARKGIEVERRPRLVDIYKLELLEVKADDYPRASIRVGCSKGTYIRTLCADVGKALGCGAHMSNLTRTRAGKFEIREAFGLEELSKITEERSLNKILIPMNKALSYPVIVIKESFVQKILNGAPLREEMIEPKYTLDEGEIVQLWDTNGELLAVDKTTRPIERGLGQKPGEIIARPLCVGGSG
ncbi:MAG TPA: tRNA pseudouridine(55) synthase TruB [Actinobacteria bacterium]|nr:tRNA pseudouridine(55) synthase TruB [Actinomycetota bacterium]